MLLGDMGANVIKIEAPDGDLGRALGPGWVGKDSALYHSFNRSKRGVSINVKTAAGLEVAKRLIAAADILVESMRPGVMDRLGLGYAQMKEAAPRIIYCSVSAYGQKGPYAERAGVDGILQADSGLMSLIGLPGSEPCKVQAPVVDVVTGYVACVGVLSKLIERQKTGRGSHLDVNLLNSALILQQSSITSYFADGRAPNPAGSAAPYSAPNQAFCTSEGWVMVAAYSGNRWNRLCELLGASHLTHDPRFATSPLRVANRVEMVAELTPAFRKKTADEWLPVLQQADILCAKVATYHDLQTHAQVASNTMFVEVEVEGFGQLRMPGLPINSVDSNASSFKAAPFLGEDTNSVLQSLGYTHEQISELVGQGAIYCRHTSTPEERA